MYNPPRILLCVGISKCGSALSACITDKIKNMNLNKLSDWEKKELFVIDGNKDFFKNGIVRKDREEIEYKKAGLPPPIYAMYGGFISDKWYSLDPMADTMDAMLKRTIIW